MTKPRTIPPGILADYEPILLLGEGAFGETYRARQHRLGRDVVLKLQHPDQRRSPSDALRFLDEAKVLARIQHPAVLNLLDFGREDDVLFLTYPFERGRVLKDVLAREGTLLPGEALEMARELLAGLEYLHRQRILHRDLKPSNILLLEDGGAKLLDFGLAKHLDEDPARTKTGLLVGTPTYLSPQRWGGEPARGSDDLYALGVILYECLTGVHPFRGTTPAEVAERHIRHAPAPVLELAPAAPRNLAALTMSLLAKEPGGRPPDATAARRALSRRATQAAPAPEPLTLSQTVPTPTGRRAPRARSRLREAALVLVLSLGIGVALAPRLAVRGPAPPGPAAAPTTPKPPPRPPANAPPAFDDFLTPGVDAALREELRRVRGGHVPPPGRRAGPFHAWLQDGHFPEELSARSRTLLLDLDLAYTEAREMRPAFPFLYVRPLESPRSIPLHLEKRIQALTPQVPEDLALTRGWTARAFAAWEESMLPGQLGAMEDALRTYIYASARACRETPEEAYVLRLAEGIRLNPKILGITIGALPPEVLMGTRPDTPELRVFAAALAEASARGRGMFGVPEREGLQRAVTLLDPLMDELDPPEDKLRIWGYAMRLWLPLRAELDGPDAALRDQLARRELVARLRTPDASALGLLTMTLRNEAWEGR